MLVTKDTKKKNNAILYQDEPGYIDERDENDEESHDEESNFYCEMCDREFCNEILLNEHKQTHKVCGIDGCTFTAHPKLIDKHINMQHRTGLYNKIKNLSTPEEIAKWISERKRKYPTKSCIETKQATILEKQQRCEVIQTNKSTIASHKSKHNNQIKKRRTRKLRSLREEKTDSNNTVEIYRGIRPFMGTRSMDMTSECYSENEKNNSTHNEIICKRDTENIDQISDDEEEKLTTNVPTHMTCKSMISLVADYNSDVDDDGPEEIPAKKIKTNIESSNLILNQATCTVSNGDKITENQMNPSVENEEKSIETVSKRGTDVQSSVKLNRSMKKSKQQNRQTLLQRLLSRSIIHERNYICQCIKYIADNNFFQS